jgi:hypothetical protein
MAINDNSHRRERWDDGLVSFGGQDYPVSAGDTSLPGPVGVHGYLLEDTRYVVFWEKGEKQTILQTVLESLYNRAIKNRVIIAELTTGSGTDYVEGNNVQLDVKADGQPSALTATSTLWKGNAAAPAYSFVGDPNTGMYSSTADQVHFSAGGTERLQVSSAGIEVWGKVYGQQGNAVGPTYSFIAGTTMGMYYKSADHLGFSAGGAERLDVSSTGITVTGGVAATGAISGTTITGSGSILGLIITASTSNNCFRGGAGSLAYPAYTFTGDLNTGMYTSAADHLSLSAGGQSITVSEAVVTSGSVHFMGIYPTNTADGTSMNGTTGRPYVNLGTYPTTASGWNWQPFNAINAGYHILAADGSEASPALYWAGTENDNNTGFYWLGSGHVGYTSDGTLGINFGTHDFDIIDSTGANTRTVNFSVPGSVGIGIALHTGSVFPKMHHISLLGSTTRRWNIIYTRDIDSTNALNESSDRNLKDNIQPTNLGLDFINDLNPVSYKWKDETVDTSTHYGIIAQDVVDTLKTYGIDSLDNFAGITYNTDNNLYGARYTEFIPILMKAVQELSAEIKELKEKN